MTFDLQNWLNYIENLHPKEMDLGLKRIRIVAKRLDVLDLNCPVITVAGTNGKGSCVKTLESILTAEGYRVGAYYSPHLQHYNERIHIAERIVTDNNLCEAFSTVNSARKNISLTYFEWGTLAALWLFKKASLDIAVLEVGLGGRLDAVNIIDPDIAVITTIDYDHMAWLGDNLESIGKEKAGIFRNGKPAVFGGFELPNSIRDAALSLNSALYCQGIDFGYTTENGEWHFWHADKRIPHLPIPTLLLQNSATALMALTLLENKRPISRKAISEGLAKAFLPGRFQQIAHNPSVILDVAHNPASCQQFSVRLQQTAIKGKTYAIIGMLSDKDHTKSLIPLLEIVDDWYVTNLACPRGAPSFELTKALTSLGIKTTRSFESVIDAYTAALNKAQINDRIIVFGSFYTVAPLLNSRFEE
jgi:dihydrofolate synthase / folylpolyglutamate synthase